MIFVVLSNGFLESSSTATLGSSFPSVRDSYTELYDYREDSDLEDEEDEDVDENPVSSAGDNTCVNPNAPCREIIIQDTAYTTSVQSFFRPNSDC